MYSIKDIDIIITTKNRSVDLLFTIDHMLSLGFVEDQFYIIDDGSTDGTDSLIYSKYPKIHLEKNPSSLGYMVNRSKMMKETKRSYILSLDDDSHIRTKEDVKEAIRILESDPEFGIFHFRVFNQIQDPPEKSVLADKFRILRGYIGCGHIIKREVIEKLGSYRNELVFYCEEIDYSLRAFKLGYKVVSNDNLIVHHRIDMGLREKQKTSVNAKGIYGREWRNIHLYSNNLIITLIYYPAGIGFLFLLYRIFLAFKFMVLKEQQFLAFFKMLGRFFSFVPYCFKEMKKLSYKEFKAWFSNPDFTDAGSV
ncbi:MAG: glycosyltransferase family 2 protein [Bacteroidia bacterium]|nr:glycosyltransferase family 2 protein [Bacteroidia bacterium]